MLKLEEKYTFNVTTMQHYYKLPVVSVIDNLFVNVSRNSIVKVHERKVLHTWTLKHPHFFTCPVVFNEMDKMLCCVTDNNKLMIWSENDDNLESKAKIKFQESVFAILPIKNERPLILFNSGKCIPLDNVISGTVDALGDNLRSTEKLIWADTASQQSKFTVLYLTQNEQTKEYKLYSYSLNKGESIIRNFSCQKVSRESCCLKCWCMNKYTENHSLIAVWSDGLITCHGSYGSTKTMLTIPVDPKSNLQAVDVIDPFHIVLLSANASKTEVTLETWDIQFSAMKCKKKSCTSSSDSDSFQISILNSVLYFVSNGVLISIPIYMERSTLASAMGKLISNSKPTESIVCTWTEKGKVRYLRPKNEQTVSPDLSAESKAEKLIEELLLKIKSSQFDLSDCYAELINISESELVQALQLAVKFKIKDSKSEKEHSKLLNLLFCIPYNDVFLIKQLRKLSFNETLAILNILQPFLSDSVDAVVDITKKPSSYQIMNWVYLILQSHIEEILLSKDDNVIKLLERFHTAVLQQIAEDDIEEKTCHLLKLYSKGNILPQRNMQEKYCFEILLI